MPDQRKIGLHFTNLNQASYRIWAPYAETIQLETVSGSYPLSATNKGFREVHDIEISHGDDYSLVINGKTIPDPASLCQPDGVEGSSMAFDLTRSAWSDGEWKGLSVNDLIIYELHTGTFTEEGTFDSIITRLDYLGELGINAIELMPVAQFPGKRNWGYDGVFPFAVQNSYGGPAGLQRLVDTCHQHNIAVILDVVINHLGPEGNFLPQFGPFFTDKYLTPWGKAINFDDEWCDGVRLFYIENILMWLRDFHVDGIRLDAVHAVRDYSPSHILKEIAEQIATLNQTSHINHFIIGECDLNDTRYISSLNSGGYGLNATWCDEFHHALHSLVTGEQAGYYSDFGTTGHLVKSFNEAFVYTGNWSEHRKKDFGTPTSGFAGYQFVVFSQNHDQVGNRMKGERLTSLVDFEMLKVIAGAVLFSPFTPLLFMGEEFAENHPFLYFINHSGKELIEQVREGRKKEFSSFFNAKEVPDPQSEKTFIQSKLTWNDRSVRQQQMFDFYRELIDLRKSMAIWKNSERKHFSAKKFDNEKILQLTREKGNELLVAILNFENREIPVITCETHIRWQLLLNSSDPEWGGPGKPVDVSEPNIYVPSHTMLIIYSP
jgi:maltooligosyltrehalose trehalohydrolase